MRSSALFLFLLCLPCAVGAQSAPLRIADGLALHEVPGTALNGATYFPVAALEHVRGQVRPDARGARVVFSGDTLVFHTFSPFFTVRGDVVQLAFPATKADGSLWLPEQFFIEWLPARYPGLVEYQSGVLRTTQSTIVAGAPNTAAPTTAPTWVATPPSQERTVPVVVLDAGHGGRDPGKIGPTGLKEKDATLVLVNRLARVLRQRGYEVQLTRTSDTLIALADRPHMANVWKGTRPALFLSIHANSVRSSSVRGFETFFLSEARTEDERRVAEMENAAIEFEDEASRVSDDAVGGILNDIRNDFYVRASGDLAEVVQDRLASFHTGPNRGVKRAGFRVLVGALMPAVLVEVAFISNRLEARLLGTTDFQNTVARNLADAVDVFFARNQHLWSGAR
ncbi:MAG: N-acetylmuramoyl-L-alanine amidase family protein [Longimicrobiales bacterium]